MNYIRPLMVFLTLFAVAPSVWAQPTEVKADSSRYVASPEEGVKWLLSAFNQQGKMSWLSQRVAGAAPKDPLLEEVDELFQASRKAFVLSVDNFEAQINGDEAVVAFDATLQDNLFNRVTQREKLRLRRVDTQWETHWDVFPGKPQEVIADEKSGIFLRLATFMAYPREMIELTNIKLTQRNLRELSTGLFMVAQDNDEKLMITAGGFENELAKYSFPKQFFSAPKSKGQEVKYSLNPRLTGLKLNQIKNPSSTILLYESQDDELIFRYQGKAALVLADGSVKMVTPEEAEKLQW